MVRKKLELLFLVFKESPPLRVKKLLNVHQDAKKWDEGKMKLTIRTVIASTSILSHVTSGKSFDTFCDHVSVHPRTKHDHRTYQSNLIP